MIGPEDRVADQRILAGVAATLRWTNVDQDGDPTAAAGTVTVGVDRADGTALVAAGTATSAGDETGEHTATLTAAQTASLDLLTATWTDGGDSSAHTTTVEVVGGYLFTVRQLRDSDPELADVGDYPTDRIIEKRYEAEVEVEWICDVAFVPRYRRLTLSGNADRDLYLPDKMVRSITSVTVDGTALTSAELAELAIVGQYREVLRRSPGDIWSDDEPQNIVVTYQHGYDRPPADLAAAVMLRTRHLLNARSSGIPTNVTAYTPDGGGRYELDKASRYRVGDPDIDAVYQRRSLRPAGDTDSKDGGSSPAGYGRPMQLDPQYGSLFHGGIR